MANFFVIEGLDGSGKSTQIRLLQEYLNKKRINFRYIHFPRTSVGIYGDLVSKFLRGDLGDNNSVNPYLVSLIYAGDRLDSKNEINEWLKNDDFVLIDRYVYSNIAFQTAKVNDYNKKIELTEWILNLEYNYNKIPKPIKSIFLEVPDSFTKKMLQSERSGQDRDYLKGKDDIHEKDLSFQEKVKIEYLRLIDSYEDFTKITCGENDIMLPPEEISKKILMEFNI